MARPVIALLTDFGLRDHYVAAMKGVILSICPDATLLDISHDIAPQDVLAGALEIDAVAPYLPPGTVVLGVVDPDVGSGRRGIALEAAGLQFVGPDNGLFSLALRRLPLVRAVELTDRRYARESVSRTFEGRDRFAPAAAWLASGVDLSTFGPAVQHLAQLDVPEPAAGAEGVDGAVLRIDRFGNLITNIPERDLPCAADVITVTVAGTTIDGLTATYSDSADGELCALVGSTGRLEIAVNGGSAAARLGASRGALVRVRRRSAA